MSVHPTIARALPTLPPIRPEPLRTEPRFANRVCYSLWYGPDNYAFHGGRDALAPRADENNYVSWYSALSRFCDAWSRAQMLARHAREVGGIGEPHKSPRKWAIR